MLEKTKLVVGKACMEERFRKTVFDAVKAAEEDARLGLVNSVLESYEIYPRRDELVEITAVFGAIPTNALAQIEEELLKTPLGRAMVAAIEAKLGEGQGGKALDVFGAILEALGGQPASVQALLELVQRFICPGLLRDDKNPMERYLSGALRCPRWPNCPI